MKHTATEPTNETSPGGEIPNSSETSSTKWRSACDQLEQAIAEWKSLEHGNSPRCVKSQTQPTSIDSQELEKRLEDIKKLLQALER
jgi:hypothetical protein